MGKLKAGVHSITVSPVIIGINAKPVQATMVARNTTVIEDFAGFSGENSRKNRPISRDFRGEKVKIRGKIGRFWRDFRGKKVKIRGTISQFHGILAEKSQFSKDFQGQILRKIGRFHGKFRGETSPRNNQ